MGNEIFSKKSIDRVSSPEQLNDYVRVSNPGVWMILGAIIILLIGVCVWGVFGHMDTKITTAGVCKAGKLTCYIKEADIASINKGMEIDVNGESFSVEKIEETPVQVTSDMNSYVLHVGELQVGEWVYGVTAETSLKDGTYEVSVITERVKPMSFILN